VEVADVFVLRIQHNVTSYEDWKRMFDSDPVDRRGGGVRRYRVHRDVGDSNLVLIDLEFDSRDEAERFQQKLRGVWEGPGRSVMSNPQASVVETVEAADL
jgi:hypothetical protein